MSCIFYIQGTGKSVCFVMSLYAYWRICVDLSRWIKSPGSNLYVIVMWCSTHGQEGREHADPKHAVICHPGLPAQALEEKSCHITGLSTLSSHSIGLLSLKKGRNYLLIKVR